MQDKIIDSYTCFGGTVKPVYKFLNVPDDLTHFQGITNNIYGFGRPFFYTRPPYFYPSIVVFTRPNDGWTGLYIKLCVGYNFPCQAALCKAPVH